MTLWDLDSDPDAYDLLAQIMPALTGDELDAWAADIDRGMEQRRNERAGFDADGVWR